MKYKTVEELDKINVHGASGWHIAAWNGTFKDIPSSFFNKKSLDIKDDNGQTVWHAAARNCLNNIPAHLFTKEALEQRYKGDTVFHLACLHNTINSVPDSLLNIESFEIQNNAGKTPDYYISIPAIKERINYILGYQRILKSECMNKPIISSNVEIEDFSL